MTSQSRSRADSAGSDHGIRSQRSMPEALKDIAHLLDGIDIRKLPVNVKEEFQRQRQALRAKMDQTKQNVQRTKDKVSSDLRQRRNKVQQDLTKTKQQAAKKWRKTVTGDEAKRIRDFIKEPRQVRSLDKFSFTLGVWTIIVGEFVFLQLPHWFPVFFSMLMLGLITTRYVMYRESKWQFFLLDFCYLANALCIAHVWLFPTNAAFLQLIFVFANGPLVCAILAWQNSLVFHSLDKVTSVFIHIFPALYTNLVRWQPVGGDLSTVCVSQSCTLSLWAAIALPTLVYLAWQIVYFFVVEGLYGARLRADPEIQTSTRWLTRDSKNAMNQLARRACVALHVIERDEAFDPNTSKTKAIFCVSQFVYQSLTILPASLFFWSRTAHTAFLLFCAITVVYNGASYYVEVFSQRYWRSTQKSRSRASSSASSS